jgi:hypothetical protein
MANERKRDNSYGLENTIVDKKRPSEMASEVSWDAEALGYDGDNNDKHTYQRKSAGFGELFQGQPEVYSGRNKEERER